MTRAACFTVGLLVGIGPWAPPLQGQITGPEVDRKAATVRTQDAPDSLGDGAEWWRWSEDEVVARMVYEPIKLIGIRRFGSPEAMVALKGVVLRTEGRIRAAMRALAAGEMEAGAAKSSMEEVLDEFRAAMQELLAAR